MSTTNKATDSTQPSREEKPAVTTGLDPKIVGYRPGWDTPRTIWQVMGDAARVCDGAAVAVWTFRGGSAAEHAALVRFLSDVLHEHAARLNEALRAGIKMEDQRADRAADKARKRTKRPAAKKHGSATKGRTAEAAKAVQHG